MHWLHRYRVSLLLIITQIPRWVEHRYRVNSNWLQLRYRVSLTTQIPCKFLIDYNADTALSWTQIRCQLKDWSNADTAWIAEDTDTVSVTNYHEPKSILLLSLQIYLNTATVLQLDQLFLLNTNPRKRLLKKVSLYLYIDLHLQEKYSISTLLIVMGPEFGSTHNMNLPSRPKFSWDTKNCPSKDVVGNQEPYAHSIKQWMMFHDGLADTNSKKSHRNSVKLC